MKFGYNFVDKCDEPKGNVVDSWMTGDMECDCLFICTGKSLT